MAQACRWIVVSEQTHYRWRKEYGGLKTDRRPGPLLRGNQHILGFDYESANTFGRLIALRAPKCGCRE